MWEKVRRRGGLSLSYSRLQGRRRGGIVGDGGWTCWETTTLIPVNLAPAFVHNSSIARSNAPIADGSTMFLPSFLSHSKQQKQEL